MKNKDTIEHITYNLIAECNDVDELHEIAHQVEVNLIKPKSDIDAFMFVVAQGLKKQTHKDAHWRNKVCRYLREKRLLLKYINQRIYFLKKTKREKHRKGVSKLREDFWYEKIKLAYSDVEIRDFSNDLRIRVDALVENNKNK